MNWTPIGDQVLLKELEKQENIRYHIKNIFIYDIKEIR